MGGLLKISEGIDRFLRVIARFGAWAGMLLVFVVIFDVITRHFGIPKPFGLNSTQVQESEYWLHTVLFSLVIGYAYVSQAHVRIDIVRDRLPLRLKYVIEVVGIVCFLIPFCIVALYYHVPYVVSSYQEHEVSKSVIGLTNIWILKSFLLALFTLLLLAAFSQLIKATAGLRGELPADKIAGTIGRET